MKKKRDFKDKSFKDSNFKNMNLDELLEISEEIKGLVSERREEEKERVIAEIKAMMQKYRLTAQDLGFLEKRTKAAAGKTGNSSSAKTIYYRGPEGQTWVGRGHAPEWIGAKEDAHYEEKKRLYRIGDDGKTPYERDHSDKKSVAD